MRAASGVLVANNRRPPAFVAAPLLAGVVIENRKLVPFQVNIQGVLGGRSCAEQKRPANAPDLPMPPGR